VISDAGVAVMSGYAALKSAALNVYINAGSLKDKEFAAQKLTELETLLSGVEDTTQAIYALVKSRL
jgi:formiminotetrahydrofolate cyclodeaminase